MVKEEGSKAASIGLFLYSATYHLHPKSFSTAFQLSSQRASTPGVYSHAVSYCYTFKTHTLKTNEFLHGAADFFNIGPITSVEQLQELLAPFLVNGNLHMRATITEVDGIHLPLAADYSLDAS